MVTSSPPSKGGASRDLAPHGCEEPFTRRLSPSPATGCGLVEAKSQDIQSGVHVPWSRESAVRTDMLTIRERLGHNATAVGSGADLGGAVRVDSLDQRTGSSGLVRQHVQELRPALCANMSETTLLQKLVYNIGAEETRR